MPSKKRTSGITVYFCCAPQCDASSRYNKEVSFHNFPTDDDIRQKWLAAIQREDFTLGHHGRVCSNHFTEEDFRKPKSEGGRRLLIKGAVPSQFVWNNPSIPSSTVKHCGRIEQPVEHDEQSNDLKPDGSECTSAPDPLPSVQEQKKKPILNGCSENQIPESRHPCVSEEESKPSEIGDVLCITSVKTKSERVATAEGKQPPSPTPSFLDPLLQAPQLLSAVGRFVCSVCSDTFATLPQLARHLQFHDQERQFPCAVCGKRFLSRSHHDEHQRVHTGERPYPCNRCKRSFTTHHNRKRHQLVHDKEEAYRCTVCGVLFCMDHQLGNIRGIINVLKQHENIQKGISTNIKLERASADERKVKKSPKLQQSHFSKDDDGASCHADVLNVSNYNKAHHIGPLKKVAPRIKKIAYDMEITL